MTEDAANHREPAEPPHEPRRWSGLPIAASLALVAFAILFGIYGPRVVDRSNPPLGIPVWELAGAVSERHRERVRLAETSGEQAVTHAEAQTAVAELLGENARIPDLSAIGLKPYEMRPILLPGGSRGAILLFSRGPREGRTFLSLTLLPDREQFVIFSSFGKPQILPVREVFPVETSEQGFIQAPALVWSDGEIVYVLHTLDSKVFEEAERVMLDAFLRPPAARDSDR